MSGTPEPPAPETTSAQPFGSRLLGPLDQDRGVLRARLQVLATVGIVVANLVGAAVVIVLNAWVLPRPTALSDSMFVANAIAVPVYLTAAVAVGVVWGTRLALRKVRWAIDDRAPDAGDQRAALQVPLRLVGVQGVLWGVAVVVFTGLALVVQPRLVFNVAFSVALGGAVTCTAAYLVTEFVMRPVAARALSVDPPDRLLVPGVKARSLLAWALGSGVPVAGLMVVAIFALVRGDTSSTQLAVTILALGGTTVLVGLLLTWLAARATVDPIRSLRAAVRRVERGDLDVEIVVYDGSEVGLLQAAFNRMVVGRQRGRRATVRVHRRRRPRERGRPAERRGQGHGSRAARVDDHGGDGRRGRAPALDGRRRGGAAGPEEPDDAGTSQPGLNGHPHQPGQDTTTTGTPGPGRRCLFRRTGCGRGGGHQV